MSKRKTKPDPKNVLLDDLESIRTLLDEDDDVEESADADLDEIEVPVLEDIVDAAPEPAGKDSEPAAGDPVPESSNPANEQTLALPDDLFRALLSDDWRDSASEILAEAREVIGDNREDWKPKDTDELNDALKGAIDETIQGWMRGMLITHMADLHETLRRELSNELKTTINHIIEQRNESTDGQ